MLLSLFLPPSGALSSCKNQPSTINRGESLTILFGIPIPTKSVLRGEIHHAPSLANEEQLLVISCVMPKGFTSRPHLSSLLCTRSVSVGADG
ncbi:hypothetical protein GYMLUDRAFT_563447 [Collybiopsis luxurians FD-317 M1]|uniref:Uncharacterized protein n=1 Tax=Collybiopsis luxurians FD-317 M1 TaxID=944289 RepID=A0A0D0CHH8_9AGAR|nr:hypothetical protein GYMLUDRAFT_563447 [Collybiopsis luxurians FD-317 M1]